MYRSPQRPWSRYPTAKGSTALAVAQRDERHASRVADSAALDARVREQFDVCLDLGELMAGR